MKHNINFLILIALLSTLSQAGFKEGKTIFQAKCTVCHVAYIPAKKIKENFFEKNNTVLKLKAPSVNMLAYAIMESSKHIGDPSDPEMQQIEIEEFLKDYLYAPKAENSICDENLAKYYDKKESMKGKVTPEEIVELSHYFMQYKKMRQKEHPTIKRVISESYSPKQLLEDASKENKQIIIEASSSTCHFCKKMKREVLDTEEIQTAMHKDYIFVEVDIDKMKLPFSLQKAFKGITPTFFFLSKEGALLNHYPGSWNSRDWQLLLKENRIKNRSK
jgi:thioredoxin-related protein